MHGGCAALKGGKGVKTESKELLKIMEKGIKNQFYKRKGDSNKKKNGL